MKAVFHWVESSVLTDRKPVGSDNDLPYPERSNC